MTCSVLAVLTLSPKNRMPTWTHSCVCAYRPACLGSHPHAHTRLNTTHTHMPLYSYTASSPSLPPGPGVADIELLDEATREVVLARARKVAGQPGAITALTKLCVGPDGPLPDLEVRESIGSMHIRSRIWDVP